MIDQQVGSLSTIAYGCPSIRLFVQQIGTVVLKTANRQCTHYPVTTLVYVTERLASARRTTNEKVRMYLYRSQK